MCLVKCQQWQESVFEKEGQASKKLINGLHMSYKKQWFATWSRFSWGLYYYHYSQKSSEQKKHYMTEGTKTCCILPLKKQKLQDSKMRVAFKTSVSWLLWRFPIPTNIVPCHRQFMLLTETITSPSLVLLLIPLHAAPLPLSRRQPPLTI